MTPMALAQRLVWDERYRIGCDMVDRQHQKLFELAGMLADAIDAHCETQVIDHVVHSLYAYVRLHFNEEEAFMEAIHYDGLEEHRRSHDQFILAFDDLVISKRIDPEFGHILLKFISNWLLKHIAHEDTQIRSS